MSTATEQRDRELFDSIAGSYVKKDLTPYCRRCRKLRLTQSLKRLARPIGRLLEVGCGAGFTARYLAGDYDAYCGLDYSEELVALAQRHHDIDNAEFQCRNVKEMDDAQRFDVILMIGVLHHIPDAEQVLRQLKPRLAADGVVIANEPQRGNPLVGLLRRIRKRMDPAYSDDQVVYSAAELAALFRNAGYDARVFPQGILSTPFAETRWLPGVLGTPLSLLAAAIDPALDAMANVKGLRWLAWNIVVEGRPAADDAAD